MVFNPDILYGPGLISPTQPAAIVETSGRCQVCRLHWTRTPVAGCEVCQRRAAWGIIIETLSDLAAETSWSVAFREAYLASLDAVAFLMTDRVRQERRARRELNDEIRDGQRSAQESYSAGRLDAQADAEGGW